MTGSRAASFAASCLQCREQYFFLLGSSAFKDWEHLKYAHLRKFICTAKDGASGVISSGLELIENKYTKSACKCQGKCETAVSRCNGCVQYPVVKPSLAGTSVGFFRLKMRFQRVLAIRMPNNHVKFTVSNLTQWLPSRWFQTLCGAFDRATFDYSTNQTHSRKAITTQATENKTFSTSTINHLQLFQNTDSAQTSTKYSHLTPNTRGKATSFARIDPRPAEIRPCIHRDWRNIATWVTKYRHWRLEVSLRDEISSPEK